MCFHLCLTSFVWHNMFSAFCLFLNFLNLFLIIFRSFPEKEMSPVFVTFIRNIWIPCYFFYVVCGICIFYLFFLFGCSGSQLWSMGYSSMARNRIRAPCFGSVESSQLDHQRIPGYSYFYLLSFFFLSFDFIICFRPEHLSSKLCISLYMAIENKAIEREH